MLLAFSALSTNGFAQRIATLEISLPHATTNQTVPVQVKLAGLTPLPDSGLSLVEVRGNSCTPVPHQIEEGKERIIYWNVEASGNPGKRTYELVKAAKPNLPPTIKTVDTNSALLVQAGTKNLLQYNYRTVYLPARVQWPLHQGASGNQLAVFQRAAHRFSEA